MFSGLHSPGQTKVATGQSKYGMPNKVHSKVVRSMDSQISGVGDDYMGPLPEGQTWSAYEAFMNIPIVSDIVGLVSGLIWGGTSLHQNKPKSQGG